MTEIGPMAASALACYIAGQENIDRKINTLCIDIIKIHGQKNTFTLDALASLQNKAGEYGEALKNQQKVLDLLIEAQKKHLILFLKKQSRIIEKKLRNTVY